MLSARFRGAEALALRQRPVPHAYRVVFRHIGLDPDVTRTPVEEATIARLVQGGFVSRGLLDDALTIALVETGVPLWALDAGAVHGELWLRLARAGERLGGDEQAPPLPSGQIVVADSHAPLAPLFGEPAPGHVAGKGTTPPAAVRAARRRRAADARGRGAVALRRDARGRLSAPAASGLECGATRVDSVQARTGGASGWSSSRIVRQHLRSTASSRRRPRVARCATRSPGSSASWRRLPSHASPRDGIAWSIGATAGPRLLGLGELERVRDDLAERLHEVRETLAARAEREARNRELLERMLRDPGRHRFVRVSRRRRRPARLRRLARAPAPRRDRNAGGLVARQAVLRMPASLGGRMRGRLI